MKNCSKVILEALHKERGGNMKAGERECTDKHSQQGWLAVIFIGRYMAAFNHIYTVHVNVEPSKSWLVLERSFGGGGGGG